MIPLLTAYVNRWTHFERSRHSNSSYCKQHCPVLSAPQVPVRYAQQIHSHGCKLKIKKTWKLIWKIILTIFLYNLIVKCGIICHEKTSTSGIRPKSCTNSFSLYNEHNNTFNYRHNVYLQNLVPSTVGYANTVTFTIIPSCVHQPFSWVPRGFLPPPSVPLPLRPGAVKPLCSYLGQTPESKQQYLIYYSNETKDKITNAAYDGKITQLQ